MAVAGQPAGDPVGPGTGSGCGEEPFNPSALGTREHWDAAYERELQTFRDIGDAGEIWFGEESMVRIIRWLERKKVPLDSSVLDIGTGNGVLLVELAKSGYTNLTGIDYSPSAIQLSEKVREKEGMSHIKLKVEDFLAPSAELSGFEICIDKGTFDAISLNPDNALGKRKQYVRSLCSVLKTEGFFLITSCNWTKEELLNEFREEKGVVFGSPLTEEGIAQVSQLIEYLHKNLRAEGLFRVPGNSIRQQILKDALNSGTDIDLDSGDFHSNDVATLLKMFLGELPEPLLTHKHFHAHLKIADLTLFDEKGNKTSTPDKERQIEALQLLFLILPAPNRSLLKLLLDLLYQTAKKQDKNKMSAHNLALMFAPHILWPRNVTANDLQENITKLNNGVTFMIKHSQKLFKAPAYIRECARLHYLGSRAHASKDDLDLLTSPGSKELQPLKSQKRSRLASCHQEETQQRTEEALKELFRHVHNMPDSAKKKKLLRQFNKHPAALTPGSEALASPAPRRTRSRSFSGLIKRKVLGTPVILERRSRDATPEPERVSKENIHLLQKCGSPAHMSQAKLKSLEGRKEEPCRRMRGHLLPKDSSSL